MDKAIKREVTCANKIFGGEHRVQFTFSFNQAKHALKKKWFLETMNRVMEQKRLGDKACARVAGVDLSGPECDASKRSLWKDVIDFDVAFVCHAGDRWNVDESYNFDLDAHLAYVEDALMLDRLSRIGHGNILWPECKAVRPSKDCAHRVFENVTVAHQKKIKEIVCLVRDKGIGINCLPKTEFRRVARMKQHPFYYWKKEGVRLHVGIDGTCYINGGLSEWIVWLLLAAPEVATGHCAVVTVGEMKKIVCVKE